MELTEERKRRHDRMYQGRYQAPVKIGRKRPAGHVIERQNKNRAKNVAQRVELKSRAITTPSAPRAAQQIELNHILPIVTESPVGSRKSKQSARSKRDTTGDPKLSYSSIGHWAPLRGSGPQT